MPDGGEFEILRDRVEFDGQDGEGEFYLDGGDVGGFDGGDGGVGAWGRIGGEIDVDPPAGAQGFGHFDGIALDEEPGEDEVFPIAVVLLAAHAVGVADEAKGGGVVGDFVCGVRVRCEIAQGDFELVDVFHGVEVESER